MGIKVLNPDVNESYLNFTSNTEGNIRFGLGGIKGVGEAAVDAILKERKTNGLYKDIYDFFERVNLSACNKKTIENLALSGAFDCFPDVKREHFLAVTAKGDSVLDILIRYGNKVQSEKELSANSLFGDMSEAMIAKPVLPEVESMSSSELSNREKDLVGKNYYFTTAEKEAC
mgnify:FL=1